MFTRNTNRRGLRDITNAEDSAPSQAGVKPRVALPTSGIPSLRPVPTTSDDALLLDTDRSERDGPAALVFPEPQPSARPIASSVASLFAAAPSAVAAPTTAVAASSSYQHSGQVDNIDARDAADPLCATEYVNDMYAYFRSVEGRTSVRPTYMVDQPHINEKMRSILVDWLVEVHLKFKLVPETLYLCVNIIDRYLTQVKVSRPKLQLVGVTALLIASKYEEIYPPELRDLVYICDRAYSKQEILAMEENILKTLSYCITIPSAHAFLVRYLKAAHADKRMVQVSCYILDNTLQSYALLKYMPSELAAAAVFLARRAAGRNSWSPTLLRYAGYCEEDITPIAREVLAAKDSQGEELKAVGKKYASSRYGGVANSELKWDL